MQLQIVNGIPCFNCTEAARAKKYGSLDRAVELGLVEKKAGLSTLIGPSEAGDVQAPESGNPRDKVSGVREAAEPRNENRPLGAGDRGTALNMLA